MTTEEQNRAEALKRLFGEAHVSIAQLNCGNGIYIEKVENHYQGSKPREEEREQPAENRPAESRPSDRRRPSGRRKQDLFVTPDGSKDEALTREKATEFRTFLSRHHWATLPLTASKESPVTKAIFAFLKKWKQEGLVEKDYSNGGGIFRFLHEDCGILTETTGSTYGPMLSRWLKNVPKNIEMEAKVEEFYLQNTKNR